MFSPQGLPAVWYTKDAGIKQPTFSRKTTKSEEIFRGGKGAPRVLVHTKRSMECLKQSRVAERLEQTLDRTLRD
jgi:hypothetical protein